MELHGPEISKEATGHQNVGEAPRSDVKADLSIETNVGAADARSPERTHCRSVSQATEEVDINGEDGRPQRPDRGLESFVLALLRNGGGLRGKDPAALSGQERNRQRQ